ncbi:hypothetical protein [Comamonas thiooxydans]|uniref:hypothetical protein n=1 Tax=Comamonas thiooxydans TaxID=363952 RepID=UPI00050E0679|nr:hypothetical protein [Comamonas thiooxydans]KGH23578.1 hypothetical protein P606_11720 [Comamonas thiooxydans]
MLNPEPGHRYAAGDFTQQMWPMCRGLNCRIVIDLQDARLIYALAMYERPIYRSMKKLDADTLQDMLIAGNAFDNPEFWQLELVQDLPTWTNANCRVPIDVHIRALLEASRWRSPLDDD